MAQTHFKPLLDSIGVTWNAATSQFDFDISNTVSALQNLYNTDRTNIVTTMLELGNTLNLSDSGKQVLDALRAQGDAGSGFTGLLGRMGYDNLIGDASDNILTGTDKDEGLYGYGGNDTLDGGAGNDYLQGGTGNDVYLFNPGSGRDGICDMDSTPGNLDTVRFGAGIAPGDITFARHGYDLVLSINGSTDQLTLENWGGGDEYRIERFEFADAVHTVWDAANDAVFEVRRVG